MWSFCLETLMILPGFSSLVRFADADRREGDANVKTKRFAQKKGLYSNLQQGEIDWRKVRRVVYKEK